MTFDGRVCRVHPDQCTEHCLPTASLPPSLFPPPEATTDLTSPVLYILQVKSAVYGLCFYVCRLSFSISFLRLIHAIVCTHSLFHLIAEQYPLYRGTTVCEHLHVDGHLDFGGPGGLKLSSSLSALPSFKLHSITVYHRWVSLPHITLIILIIIFNFLGHLHVTGSGLSTWFLSAHPITTTVPYSRQYAHTHGQRGNWGLRRPSSLFKLTHLVSSKTKIRIKIYLMSLLQILNNYAITLHAW